MSGQEPSHDGSALFLLLLGAGCVLYRGWEKVRPVFIQFETRHTVLFQFSIFALGGLALLLLVAGLWNRHLDYRYSKDITAADSKATLLGTEDSGERIYLKEAFRTSHIQVIGTTNAGKTESVILPLIIKDIENQRGLVIIDGKSDRSFLNKLYAYVAANKRQDDFRLFSLGDIDHSSSFNPLLGGSPQEVVERVFSAFAFENEYYRNVQYKILLALMRLIHERNLVPTFRLLHKLLTDMDFLGGWIQVSKDEELKRHLAMFRGEAPKERTEKTSGLDAYLTHFSEGEFSQLFNSENPGIQLDLALKDAKICYFQLPTMFAPFLAEATGKLVLQSFQSAVAKRHLGLSERAAFFSCYLDDFQDYIYPGFAALLNKSRSANVGMVFSHQALGDLDKVSPAFANIVTTNTNIKFVMRNSDPETCEYFSKSFGTRSSEQVTERRNVSILGESKTGEGSIREVEEFIHHPNAIRSLAQGEAIVSIPHPKGVRLAKIKCSMRANLPELSLPKIEKTIAPMPIPAGARTGGTSVIR